MTSLREELESLQRKLTWRIRLQGLVSSLFLVSLVTLILIAADHQLRPELSLIRYLLSIVFWVNILVVIAFRLVPIWLRKPKMIDIAFAVESALKKETGEIAAAIDIERQEEANQQVQSLKESLSKSVLDRDLIPVIKLRSRFFIIKTLLVLIAISIIALLSPTSTVIAMSRIGNPNSDAKWPRFTKLEIFDASSNKVSPGSVISQVGQENSQFYVIDQYGAPPEEVLLEVRQGSQAVKQVRLTGVNERLIGVETQTVFEFRLVPNPAETLQFRVIGGDDTTMPWTNLLRELKPAVQSLTCEISPPEYLGLSKTSIENWAGRLQVPAETALNFNLQLNRSVVEFRVQDQLEKIVYEQTSRTDRFAFPLQIPTDSDDQLQYELLVKTSHEATTDDWIRVKRLQIDPVLDQPPLVKLLRPTQDRNVTSAAVIPIQATARDDYGLKLFRIVIATAKEFSLSAEDLLNQQNADLNGELTIHLTKAEVGDSIDLAAEAYDFNPSAEPAMSETVRLHIVSEKEKSKEINTGLTHLAREISAGLAQQQQARRSSVELLGLIQEPSRSKNIYNALNLLEVRLNLFLNRFRNSTFQEQVDSLQAEIDVNKISIAVYDSALQAIEESFQEKILPRIDESVASLQSIQKNIEPLDLKSLSEQNKAKIRDHLQFVITNQDAAIQSTADLVNQLSQWIDTSDIELQWNLIQSDLKKSMEPLPDIARDTISKELEELTAEQRKRLQESAGQHLRLSDRLRKLHVQLKPIKDAKWRLLGELFSKSEVFHQVQVAANAIQQNNILEAIEIDQRVLGMFSDFERELSNQELKSRSQLIDLLKMLQDRFDRLTSEQLDLNMQWRSDGIGERIKRGQIEILDESKQLLEEIERLGIGQVADLFNSYFTIVRSLLDSSENTEQISFDNQTQEIEQILAQIEIRLRDSLQRLLKRDQEQLLNELKQLAQKLFERQNDATSSLEELLKEEEENERLSRRQRRELLDISKFERELVEALQPFQSQVEQGTAIHQSLIFCISRSRDLAKGFEQAEIGTPQLDTMQSIAEHLSELAQVETSVDSSTASINEQLTPEIRDRLQQLLERQQNLVLEEQKSLSETDSLSPAIQESFIQRQREIDLELKSLLIALEPELIE